MAEIRIRNLDEDVVQLLRGQARRHGKSLGIEVREILSEIARKARNDAFARIDAIRESIRDESGTLPDSAPGIRAERDTRG